MAGRLKVYNESTGQWEYINSTQPVLRYVPLTTPIVILNGLTTTANIAQSHTPDIGDPIPMDAVAVAVTAISRHSAVTTTARFNILDYGGSVNRIQSIAGKVSNHYETTAAAHWVTLGGTRQIDYQIDIGAAGTLTYILTVLGYWTYQPSSAAYPIGASSGYGTAFPGGPAVNDRFFRTDLGMEFFWNGTRWLCMCPHQFTMAGVGNLTATTTDQNRTSVPPLPSGLDLWIESGGGGYHVAGGTALSASHKWLGRLGWNGITGETAPWFYQKTIDSGASSVWRVDADTPINLLLSAQGITRPGTFIWIDATKTGTPGNFYWYPHFNYRYVAT